MTKRLQCNLCAKKRSKTGCFENKLIILNSQFATVNNK